MSSVQHISGDQVSIGTILAKEGASHISAAKKYPRVVIFLIGMSMMSAVIVLFSSLFLGNAVASQKLYDHFLENLDVSCISMPQMLYEKAEAGEDMCATYIQNCFTEKIEVSMELAIELLDEKLTILSNEVCVVVRGFPMDSVGMEEDKRRV